MNLLCCCLLTLAILATCHVPKHADKAPIHQQQGSKVSARFLTISECIAGEGIDIGGWTKSAASEIKYWDEWIKNRGNPYKGKGGAWIDKFAERMVPNKKFQKEYALRGLGDEGQTHFRVLDVGAGPISYFGNTLSEGELELIPIDPLAKEYDELWAKHGLTPPVRTRPVAAENISRVFPEDSFDMVLSRHALDHAIDPVCDLKQMLKVLKPEHQMLIEVYEDEAMHEHNAGMRQWNFVYAGGSLVVGNDRLAKSHNINREFDGVASISCTAWQLERGKGRTIKCVLTKRGATSKDATTTPAKKWGR